jgi:subtilisin family serine protease
MKKFLLAICIIASFGTGYAQDKASSFTDRNSDQPRDPRVDQMSFVPNEVLVKFKDEVPLNSAARLRSAGLSAVDKVLQANGIDSLVRLFPNTKSSLLRSAGVARIVKDPQGRDMKIPNLDKIYKITLPQLRSTSSVPVNIFQVIEDLKALPEVEYAEPNYIYSVDDLQPVGPVLTADDVKKMQSGLRSSQSAVVPNDPLYSQQWYIPAVKADLVWEQTTGDTTQVIGILDTGVDWNHPDLKNKIWSNPGEIPGNGIDDDGNGLIDDVRGWDYINNDNNPMDDNSHGTHVAGIAAAETNNGIGIAGVNWKAKIMPIKVFQYTGIGDASTIAKGIEYAFQKGATVINMSFGSYSQSLVMEDVLTNAYATSVLVAAAGNGGYCIGPDICNLIPGIVFFPAGLPYVLGVQANADYSNYDHDGAVFSKYIEGYNYELIVPGSAISTTPFGNYKVLNGTSMASPIVSGIVALYKSFYPHSSTEMLWGDLVHSSDYLVDSYKSLFPTDRNPIFDLVEYFVTDTIGDGDGDNQPDAGETVELWIKVRNTYGNADSVFVFLEKNIYADSADISIVQDSAFLGNLSAYATITNNASPLSFQVNNLIQNGKFIPIDVVMKNGINGKPFSQTIHLEVYNGEELSGLLSKDTILSADKLWLINSNLRIATGVKVTLEPGSHLQINAGLDNRGTIEAIGNKYNRINIEGTISGNLNLEYVDFDLKKNAFSGNAKHCNFDNGLNVSGNFENCTFTNFTNDYLNWGVCSAQFDNCMIKNFTATQLYGSSNQSVFDKFYINGYSGGQTNFNSKYSVYNEIGNTFKFYSPYNRNFWEKYPASLFNISSDSQVYMIYKNAFIFNDETSYFVMSQGSNDVVNLSSQYWGTTDSLKIRNKYYDFWNNVGKPFFFHEKSLTQPSDSCHAHVWKIKVNGKDAQDEFIEPLGVGKQRFDIYFNRPMDTIFKPVVSFGVRLPYNQQSVNEDGSWSNDSTIYTIYKTIKLTTGDGLNRIRVSGAKESDGWENEIPVEDTRFEFLISAASSSSLDFMATPGLGKVKLEWNNNDLEDGLGYNMYRMEHINDSTLTAPVIINTSLINDTLYTDYSVVPNRKYYYTYKVVRTDLSETDPSRVVSAIPFTASKGDANGDLSVNVLDITTIVAYLLNNNPQPFITEAADMNSDGNINVLDIVGVVNKVLYGGLRSANSAEVQQASLYLQNDTLFADATTAIGGLQFDVNGISSITDIQVLDALQVFESGYSQRDSTTLRLLYYSMSGKSIAAGSRIPLLKLKKDCKLKDIIVSDKAGALIPVSLSDPAIGNRNSQGRMIAELGQNYPNPSMGQTTLPVQIFEKVDEAAIGIYNMLGQQVKVIKLDNPTVGKHEILWNSLKNKGLFIYKLEIRSEGQQYVSPLKKMIIL